MFDRMLVVDWSAANGPRTGRDSIWIADVDAEGAVALHNPSTRHEATAYVATAIERAIDRGERLLAGFDFAFGYPAATDALPGEGAWEAVWAHLADHVEDDEGNRSNRFEVAAALNRRWPGGGPFWGHPPGRRYDGLAPTRPDYDRLGVRERRHIDRAVPAASPVWKLAYTGSVGSQTILGIARLEGLRRRFGSTLRVWPFETDFASRLDAPAVLAEIYPSLWPHDPALHPVKDACQVATLARGFAAARDGERLAEMLRGPKDGPARDAALAAEGWMVGFTDERVALQ